MCFECLLLSVSDFHDPHATTMDTPRLRRLPLGFHRLRSLCPPPWFSASSFFISHIVLCSFLSRVRVIVFCPHHRLDPICPRHRPDPFWPKNMHWPQTSVELQMWSMLGTCRSNMIKHRVQSGNTTIISQQWRGEEGYWAILFYSCGHHPLLSTDNCISLCSCSTTGFPDMTCCATIGSKTLLLKMLSLFHYQSFDWIKPFSAR